MTPGIGQKSVRSEALELRKLNWPPERIAEALDVEVEKVREWIWGKPRTQKPSRGSISEASPAQRKKVRDAISIISGQAPCDPAHLWPRSLGGCDHPDCIVPLTRAEHRLFDKGELDILPHLIARQCWEEIAHMVEAHHADPIAVVERLTGEKWAPMEAVAA